MYHHVQRSPLQYLLLLFAAIAFVIAWQFRQNAVPGVVAAVVGAIVLMVAFSFQTLTVYDDDRYLRIRYGPLSLFGGKIAYHDMTGVQADRTLLIDGWGIHFVPFRGWVYNLWGFECVRIELPGRTIRVGTDDSANLVRFIRQRIDSGSEGV